MNAVREAVAEWGETDLDQLSRDFNRALDAYDNREV